VSYELELPGDSRIHDVFHVSLLRPHRRRGGEQGSPPVLMPNGEIQYEVQEILQHVDDADNERWYEVRRDDGSISWIPERDAYNCWDKVSEYFAKHGMTARRPPSLAKRGRRKGRANMGQARGDTNGTSLSPQTKSDPPQATQTATETAAETAEENTEETSARRSVRSVRSKIKRLMCMYPAKARAYKYGESFPELY